MNSRVARLLQNRLGRRLLLHSSPAVATSAAASGEASSRHVARYGGAANHHGFLSTHGVARAEVSSLGNLRWYTIKTNSSNLLTKHRGQHLVFRSLVSSCASYSTQASNQSPKEETKDLSAAEDPFDAPTYNIPEKPVTFVEGASYSIVILVGLGIAALAAYGVFKELIFEPKEYKVFGKALARVQNDSQVTVRIGSPVTGYGQETRNRAARQRIPNRVWTDEDGVEHVEVNFYIRGPHGAGKVYAEMFKHSVDRTWKFTYLIVEIKSPQQAQLMLESYMPAATDYSR